jgi:hypothetical protein
MLNTQLRKFRCNNILIWTLNNIPTHHLWSDQVRGIKTQNMQTDHTIDTKPFLIVLLKLKHVF